MSLLSKLMPNGPTGYGYGSTAEGVTEGRDLSGRTILVTGVNSGLGAETLRVLTMRGAHVVGTARTVEKAELACADYGAQATPIVLELSEPSSVLHAVESVTEACPPLDAIITNAAGCGSHLKHYHGLLKEDPVYAEKATLWDQRVKDIHEWLGIIGVRPPANPSDNTAQVVTYHEACHLAHGQKITSQPRDMLRCIPGLELKELAESNWCCGSAGIYNIVQPETADQLLQRKLDHIEASKATIVATGNPGCLLQIQNGAKDRGLPLRIVHPITLLAEAYRRESL